MLAGCCCCRPVVTRSVDSVTWPAFREVTPGQTLGLVSSSHGVDGQLQADNAECAQEVALAGKLVGACWS